MAADNSVPPEPPFSEGVPNRWLRLSVATLGEGHGSQPDEHKLLPPRATERETRPRSVAQVRASAQFAPLPSQIANRTPLAMTRFEAPSLTYRASCLIQLMCPPEPSISSNMARMGFNRIVQDHGRGPVLTRGMVPRHDELWPADVHNGLPAPLDSHGHPLENHRSTLYPGSFRLQRADLLMCAAIDLGGNPPPGSIRDDQMVEEPQPDGLCGFDEPGRRLQVGHARLK